MAGPGGLEAAQALAAWALRFHGAAGAERRELCCTGLAWRSVTSPLPLLNPALPPCPAAFLEVTLWCGKGRTGVGAMLAALPGARVVALTAGGRLAAGDLRHLPALQQLRCTLRGAASALAELPRLERLVLTVPAAGLAGTPPSLPSLTRLTLRGAFARPQLGTLLHAQRHQLRELWLEGLTDVMAVPPEVAGMERLTSVAIIGWAVFMQAGWSPLLAHSSRLRALQLNDCSLPAVPAAIGELTALTRLCLAGNDRLTAGGCAPLARLTRLRQLSLAGTAMRRAPVVLVALPALERLALPRGAAAITVGGFSLPACLPQLTVTWEL